jgi:hypothetical protein
MINSEDADNKILRNTGNYTPNNTAPCPTETSNSATLLLIPASQNNQVRKSTSLTFLVIFFSRPNKIPRLFLLWGHYRICLVFLLSIIHYHHIILCYKYD